MKDPTNIIGIEMSEQLITAFRQLPKLELDDFLQRCKVNECLRIAGAQTEADRLKVQHRQEFVEEWRNFFKSLLTK